MPDTVTIWAATRAALELAKSPCGRRGTGRKFGGRAAANAIQNKRLKYEGRHSWCGTESNEDRQDEENWKTDWVGEHVIMPEAALGNSGADMSGQR